MPRRDLYHDTVRNALIKDGWTIAHDPYVLGDAELYVFQQHSQWASNFRS